MQFSSHRHRRSAETGFGSYCVEVSTPVRTLGSLWSYARLASGYLRPLGCCTSYGYRFTCSLPNCGGCIVGLLSCLGGAGMSVSCLAPAQLLGDLWYLPFRACKT